MESDRISIGIENLDSILGGGLIKQKSYLIKGGPGTGKSTIGYHFLEKGASNNERTMLITLGELGENIRAHTKKQGIDLSDTEILDLSQGNNQLNQEQNYSVFSPVEVEAQPIIQKIVEAIEKHQPERIMLDSLTMLKYLYQNQFQYKSMALSLINHVCSMGATLLMISETHPKVDEDEAEFWVDGVLAVSYSEDWRRISVRKFRGSSFQDGEHAIKINEKGISVFPRLQPNKYDRIFSSEPISSGIDELDEMLHGGIEKGTISMFTGPTGAGKTNLGMQFMKQASIRGGALRYIHV